MKTDRIKQTVINLQAEPRQSCCTNKTELSNTINLFEPKTKSFCQNKVVFEEENNKISKEEIDKLNIDELNFHDFSTLVKDHFSNYSQDIKEYFIKKVIYKGDFEKLKLLEKNSIELQKFVFQDNNTPLHIAINCLQIDIIKYLIEKGTDLHKENLYKTTPKKIIKVWLDTNFLVKYDKNKYIIEYFEEVLGAKTKKT